MKRSDVSHIISATTDGLAGSLTDTLLFLFYLYGASFGKRGSRGIYDAFQEAETALADINYQTIKRAINTLTQGKFINRSPKRSTLEVEITSMGKKRIDSLFPVFHEKRPWDGHIYLVSYDIPNNRTATRNLLREYIRRSGGALLQESLWINPYNPTDLLEKFSHLHHIDGTLLVSKLGKDGTIGNFSLQQLITNVYHLEELKSQYQNFLSKYSKTSTPSPLKITLDYFSILKKDPQLPRELLPKNFPDNQAHLLFLQLTKQ